MKADELCDNKAITIYGGKATTLRSLVFYVDTF